MPTFEQVTERMRLEPAYMEAVARFRKSEAETRILDAQRQRMDATLAALRSYRDEVEAQITRAKQRAAQLERRIEAAEKHRDEALRLLRGQKLNLRGVAWRSFTFFLNDAIAAGGTDVFEELAINPMEYLAQHFIPAAHPSGISGNVLGLVDFMRSLGLSARLGSAPHRDLVRLFVRIDAVSEQRRIAMQQTITAIENGTLKDGRDRLDHLAGEEK